MSWGSNSEEPLMQGQDGRGIALVVSGILAALLVLPLTMIAIAIAYWLVTGSFLQGDAIFWLALATDMAIFAIGLMAAFLRSARR